MIKNLVKHVERQPVSTLLLAVAGVAATVAIARAASQNPQPASVVRRRVRQAGDQVADLAEGGARRVAEGGAEAAKRGSRLAAQAGDQGSSLLDLSARLFGQAEEQGAQLARSGSQLAERAGKRGSEWAHRGSRLARRHTGNHGVKRLTASMGIEEKTLAVFLATILAKSATGFLRWRAEQTARHQAEALASAEGEDVDAQLEGHTVVELRKQARERDIAGRSSMSKDELMEALKGGG